MTGCLLWKYSAPWGALSLQAPPRLILYLQQCLKCLMHNQIQMATKPRVLKVIQSVKGNIRVLNVIASSSKRGNSGVSKLNIAKITHYSRVISGVL